MTFFDDMRPNEMEYVPLPPVYSGPKATLADYLLLYAFFVAFGVGIATLLFLAFLYV